jgi:iron complex outermembrane recepter protein
MNRSALVLLTSSAAAGVAFSADVRAQQQTASADQLQEVVVTAERRSETAQTTPISITAITGQDISSRGVTDLDTLAQAVPGLAIKSSGPGQTEFEMRGLASVGGNSAVVGFYLDDVPLSAPGGQFNGRVVIDPNLYDLNRVEVLRGPQGTLYGSSSMGGTVKVVTNSPDPTAFDASGEAIASDTRSGGGFNEGVNGMLNVPLGDTAALRIVVSQEHNSGWIDRIVSADESFPTPTNFQPGPPGCNCFLTRGDVLTMPIGKVYSGVNDEDLTGARATLLWNATERLDITPMFFYQYITQGGLNQIDSDPGTNAHYQPFDFPEGFDDRIYLGSLTVKYRFDSFELTSVTARFSREEKIKEDPNEQVDWILSEPPVVPPGVPFPYYIDQGGFGPIDPDTEIDTSNQTSEELRLTSTGNSAFQWLLGYFYSDFGSSTNLDIVWPGAEPAVGTSNGFNQIQPIKILQNSFFGEASYKITDQLKATVGLRRYSFVSQLTNTQSGFLSATASDASVTTHAQESDQGVSPKFNLSYQATPDLLTYATVARGFRPGGGNQILPTTAGAPVNCEPSLMAVYNTTEFVPSPQTFKPDDIWSYEIGEKSEWLEHRLQLNAAAYFEQWNDVQQYVPLACGYPFTANAGDAHVYGGELELNALLTTGLTFLANGSYTHGSFVSGSFHSLTIASGNQLQNIPEWTTAQSLAYRVPLSEGLTGVARIDNSYIGSRIDVTFGVNQLPSYDLTNLRVGVEGAHWAAMLFANNVANKRALIDNVLQYNIDAATFNRVTVSQPLTFGIDFTVHLR